MDFEMLFKESPIKEELPYEEYKELLDSFPGKAEKARLALEDWLTTFKRLGFWSSYDEVLRCIVNAYYALGNPESELLKEDPEDEDFPVIESDEIYKAIKKDLDEGKLNSGEIHIHFIKFLKKEDSFKDIPLKWLLYPVDKVKHAGSDLEPCIAIAFLCGNTQCFALGPESTYEELFNEKFRDDIYHWPSD